MAETEAISLRVTAYGESDLIVTLLGAQGGKIRGIARGARKSRKRFGAGLDPGNRGMLSYHAQPRSELANVDGFANARPPALGPDAVAGFAALSVALECCEAVSVEGEDAGRRFALLVSFLSSVADAERPIVTLAWFLAALLDDAGFAPRFDACARCERSIGNRARFDAARIALVCAQCTCEAPVGYVSPELAGRISALTPANADVEAAATAAELLGAAVEHLIGRPLKSLEFLRATRSR